MTQPRSSGPALPERIAGLTALATNLSWSWNRDELRAAARPLAVFVDDGEKFGGWPGTKDWVYTRGWLAQFLDAVGACVAAGDVRLNWSATSAKNVYPGPTGRAGEARVTVRGRPSA